MIKKQKIEKEIVYDDFFGPLPWYIKNLEQNKYEIISIIKHLYITYNCNFINGNALFSKEIIDIINKNLLNHNYVINDFKKQPEETEDHILRALDEIIAIKDNSKNAIDFCYDILNCLMFGYGLTKFNELFNTDIIVLPRNLYAVGIRKGNVYLYNEYFADYYDIIYPIKHIANVAISNNVLTIPNPILNCDSDTVLDGFRQFDLNVEISPTLQTGLPTGLIIAYYATENNAIVETNQLPNSFINTCLLYTSDAADE